MRVVIVEDNSINLDLLCTMVGKLPHVAVQGFSDPALALADARQQGCDLLIADYVMPGISGLELIEAMRQLPSHAHVPMVMITADDDRAVRMAAIAAGATDFVTKPADPLELRSRVTNLLALRGAQNALADRAACLAAEIAEATRDLQRREEEIICRLARAIGFRDGDTGDHVDRVAQIARMLAEALGEDETFVRNLGLVAPLHDVGKIGVPDAILNKPGRLDPDELAIMRGHVGIGAKILAGGDSDLVQMAEAIAAGHHERWDGTGYPQGLAGSDIPLAARITAVADVFDALCSERPYKRAWPAEEAYAEICRCAGSHFDPACVAAFARSWPRIAPLVGASPDITVAA
jgi:putative two-component system response regulator